MSIAERPGLMTGRTVSIEVRVPLTPRQLRHLGDVLSPSEPIPWSEGPYTFTLPMCAAVHDATDLLRLFGKPYTLVTRTTWRPA